MVTPIPEPDLTPYEREFLSLFGSFFERRGNSRMLGQLVGLLLLKAPDPKKGLDQQQIAPFLQRSVSSTSRMLKDLERMKMCKYIDVINENSRRERKYYMNTNFGKMLTATLKRYVLDNQRFIEEITQLGDQIKPEETEENSDLIQYCGEIVSTVEQMKIFWAKMAEVSGDLFK